MTQRFTIVPENSTIIINARTSAGPVAWEGTGPTGEFEAEIVDGLVEDTFAPIGWLDLEVTHLTSGNRVYDGELMRRIDARRFPTSRVVLRTTEQLVNHSYLATADVSFHGIERSISGTLSLMERDDGSVLVTAEQDIDIRDFDIPAPTMLLLKIYPDVRVSLVVEARPV